MNGAIDTVRKPFIEHIGELRTRLTWIGLIVIFASGGAFLIHQQLLDIIQKPLDQTLYFTSPTGGLSFIFQLCLTVGIIVGFPVIVYHAFRFLSPLVKKQKTSTIFLFISASFLLACAGLAFAYFISLPAALKFLTQFGGENIESLIKADEYFSFALAYLGGFAILFQIPLVVLFINRITPLKPSKMLRTQRWIILGSFIAAAILTPTPDPINQTLMAAPAIALYQLSILLVFLINKGKKRSAPKIVEIDAIKAKNASPTLVPSLIISSPRPTPKPARVVSDFVNYGYSRQSIKPPARKPVPITRSKENSRKRPESPRMVHRRIQNIDGII